MTQLPYPTTYNDIIKCQIMESKSNYYHLKNDENNWNLIKQIINKYSVSHLEKGCFLSDCIGSTYDIEDIYNNMKGIMLVFNTDYQDYQDYQEKKNKKRKIEPSEYSNNRDINNRDINNRDSNNRDSNNRDSNDSKNNMFNGYYEIPDFMFRKKHAQHFLQTFKLPIEEENSPWPFTIYFFSGDYVYFSDGYNGSKCGDLIFKKSINNQPIIFTNFINQLC